MLIPRHKWFFLLLLISVLVASVITPSAGAKKWTNRSPFRVVLDRSELTMTPGQSVEVQARVLDRTGNEMTGVRISWRLPSDANQPVQVRQLDALGTRISLSTSSAAAPQLVRISVKAGIARAELAVNLQSRAPSKIVFDKGKKIELAVGGSEKICGLVFDAQGNRVQGAEVKWRLAKDSDDVFVYPGRVTNTAAENCIEILWRPGAAGVEAPDEVQLIAYADGAVETITIKYKVPPSEDYEIELDKKELEIQPGETSALKATVKSAKDGRILKVKVKPQLADDTAAKLIKIIGPDKDNNITLVGVLGDANTPPIFNTALVVSAAGAYKSIPIRYRRDPIKTVWDILPPRIVGDNYGRTLKNDYYCIEVTIENNSGSDIALAGLFFNHDGWVRPVTSYSTVHGSLAKRKLTHPRSLTLATVDAVGSLMTGFNPFFHNESHAVNFSQFIDIVSNPLAKGLASVWKDSYPDELARFEQDVLKDDKNIKNGETFKTKVFFPKRALFINNDPRREDFIAVRQELGQLWVMGYKFQRGPYQNFSPTR
jgi:hypothetical protein